MSYISRDALDFLMFCAFIIGFTIGVCVGASLKYRKVKDGR